MADKATENITIGWIPAEVPEVKEEAVPADKPKRVRKPKED